MGGCAGVLVVRYYLAPFVRVNKLSYQDVKQNIQSFIFGVNTPSRWGSQAPFTNITLDWVVPADLADQPAIVGGKPLDVTYGIFKKKWTWSTRRFWSCSSTRRGRSRIFVPDSYL